MNVDEDIITVFEFRNERNWGGIFGILECWDERGWQRLHIPWLLDWMWVAMASDVFNYRFKLWWKVLKSLDLWIERGWHRLHISWLLSWKWAKMSNFFDFHPPRILKLDFFISRLLFRQPAHFPIFSWHSSYLFLDILSRIVLSKGCEYVKKWYWTNQGR